VKDLASALFWLPSDNGAKSITPLGYLPLTIWNGLLPVDLFTKLLMQI
jgi:hypothetical protein